MKKSIVYLISCLFLISSCQHYKTIRKDPNEITDIGDKWNDTDSRLVSEEMIDDILRGSWLRNFYKSHHGDNPVIIFGRIKNRANEDIDGELFISNLQKALVNSGEVHIVADSFERAEIRTERLDQASNASEETVKYDGDEMGADFMLNGETNSIVTEDGSHSVKYYQVNLSLMDMETNKKVWIGEKKIKKSIASNRFF